MRLSKERAARWSPRAGDMVGETQPNQEEVGGACQKPPTSLSVSLHFMTTSPSSQSTLFLLVRDLPSHHPICTPEFTPAPQSSSDSHCPI